MCTSTIRRELYEEHQMTIKSCQPPLLMYKVIYKLRPKIVFDIVSTASNSLIFDKIRYTLLTGARLTFSKYSEIPGSDLEMLIRRGHIKFALCDFFKCNKDF